MSPRIVFFVCFLVWCSHPVVAEVGDPQIRTDHPWYPGELAISDFELLFKTQENLYRRVTGRPVDSDQAKVIASWLWRNTHYWHGETGKRDLWGEGFQKGSDMRPREYWNGLFSYGFGLCGTTHSQWTAELDQRLGHCRSRGVGAAGHNAFEVFLTGDSYGPAGRWALLDHDLSTLIFDGGGRRLLGLGEIQGDVDRWIDRTYQPEKQQGWLVCGLHPSDGESYRRYAVAEYLAGYAGPPPKLHLRRGERMRRYFQPGLDDGKTYVFWGRNYNTDSIPGPERSRTWVNQPDQMFRSTTGTPHRNGQARFANVEFVYRPDFESGDYREAVVREHERETVFEFQSPYVIGATPPNLQPWGIYESGCRNGLVVSGRTGCSVSISVDDGRTWTPTRRFDDGQLDLTDAVKGRCRYWIRFDAGPNELKMSELQIRTVCQANVAVLPRLKDGGTTVHYQTSDSAVRSIGPEIELAKTYLTDGAFGSPNVTLAVTPNRTVKQVFAAAHIASGSPPNQEVAYQIEWSNDHGQSWKPVVADWEIRRRGDEPKDFWSQSFCYGSMDIRSEPDVPVQIRFRNDGGKRYLRAEAHLVVETETSDPMAVTYRWTDSTGDRRASHLFHSSDRWTIPTERDVVTRWVEFEPRPQPSNGN